MWVNVRSRMLPLPALGFFPLSSQAGMGLANLDIRVTAEGERLCQPGMNKLESRFQQRKSKIPS